MSAWSHCWARWVDLLSAPFLPRHPAVYGNLLRKLIAEQNVDCWLVNTGVLTFDWRRSEAAGMRPLPPVLPVFDGNTSFTASDIWCMNNDY